MHGAWLVIMLILLCTLVNHPPYEMATLTAACCDGRNMSQSPIVCLFIVFLKQYWVLQRQTHTLLATVVYEVPIRSTQNLHIDPGLKVPSQACELFEQEYD